MTMAEQGIDKDNKEAYRCFLFLLAVTIAHELVHCFMCSVSTDERLDTPIELDGTITGTLDGNACWGDSGTVWEFNVLGGILIVLEEPNHPLGDRQAGRLWIVGAKGKSWPLDADDFTVKRTFDPRSMFAPSSGLPKTASLTWLDSIPLNPILER
jgi:hypothetical protein